MNSLSLRNANLSEDPHFFGLLTRSYARLVGTALVPEGCGPEWLYHEAPFAVVAQTHGLSTQMRLRRASHGYLRAINP